MYFELYYTMSLKKSIYSVRFMIIQDVIKHPIKMYTNKEKISLPLKYGKYFTR